MSSAGCLSLLKSKDADYSKGTFSSAMKKLLIDGIETASTRAKAKESYENPSTTVHLLVDEIMEQKKA